MVTLPPQKKLCIQVRGDSFAFSEQSDSFVFRSLVLFYNCSNSATECFSLQNRAGNKQC